MWSYLARRIAQTIPVFFGISVITFVLIYYLPADPARMYAGPSATVATVARIRHELGLDQPLWIQYIDTWDASSTGISVSPIANRSR